MNTFRTLRRHLLASMIVGVAMAQTTRSLGASYTLAIPPGVSTIANHLEHGGNTVAELFPGVPEGTLLYKFDSTAQAYSVNQFQSGAWLRPQETLAPGEGAFIRNPGAQFTITFAGEKPANSKFPTLTTKLNLVSLPVPGETSLPAKAGDSILRFDADTGRFRASVFDDLDNAWIPPFSPADLQTGESFFYSDPRLPFPSPAPVSGPQVYFATFVPGAVDARVELPGETEPGQFTAQLFVRAVAPRGINLVPLTPATTFQTSSPAVIGYVKPVAVTVPQTLAAFNAQAEFILRVFDGTSYENSRSGFFIHLLRKRRVIKAQAR